MVNALTDALNKPDDLDTASIQTAELGSGTVLGANISGGVVTTAHLGANIVTAAKQKLVGTGSPTVYGLSVQTGSIATTPGSLADIVFGTAFAAAPHVQLTPYAGTNNYTITLVVGSLTTTGVTVHSHGAGSVLFSWTAIGSGTI